MEILEDLHRSSRGRKIRHVEERPFNIAIPGKLHEAFQDLLAREGREKKLLGAIALFILSRQDEAGVLAMLKSYNAWLRGDLNEAGKVPEPSRAGSGLKKRKTQ